MRARLGKRLRHPVAAGMAMAVMAGCARHAALAPPPVASPRAPAPSQPECAPIALDPTDEDEAPAAAPAPRAQGPLVDLAVLVRPVAPARSPRKRIDLGRVSAHVEPAPPGDHLDIPMTNLPRALPRADLPADLQALWDRDDAARREHLLVMLRRARLTRKKRECTPAACPELACLEKRGGELDDEARRVGERGAALRRELGARLRQHLAALGDRAPAGAILALAGTLEEIARVDGEGDDRADLVEASVLYRRAAALAAPDSDAGWFARYRLAATLDDTDARGEAEAVLRALAQASPTGPRAADASYHAGNLEQDPGRATDFYARAAAMAPRGSGIHENALRMGARSALAAERPADALAAGLLIVEDDVQEGAEVVGEALGRMLPSSPGPSLQKVPAAAFAPIAAQVARRAVDHLDFALATRAWEAIVARTPDAPEAAAATAGLAAIHARAVSERVDLERRLAALARDCAHTHLFELTSFEFEVQVTSAASGPAKVTVQLARPGSPTNLTRCLAARGPAYFVDAPADLRATLTLTTADLGASSIGSESR